MKDKKKLLIIAAIVVAIIVVVASFFFFTDENKLTKQEKNWIADNLNVVQNVNVINDSTVFGDNGSGVFYDFLNDLQLEHNIKINPVTFLEGEKPDGNTFVVSNEVGKNSTVFYEDHYVIVGKNADMLASSDALLEESIGVLSTNKEYVQKYLNNLTFKDYENKDALYKALKEDSVKYIIVPLISNINDIFQNDYKINYHFSDIKFYYSFNALKDDYLASIIKKYFNNWKEESLEESLYSNKFIAMTNALNISDSDISKMQSVNYKYGFTNHNPYEIIAGGNFGGISAIYLDKFSKFADVEFKFKKYRNLEDLKEAINKKDVDIYFNYYNFTSDLTESSFISNIKFDIIAKNDNNLTLNNLSSLDKLTIYVHKNTKLSRYLKANSTANLKYYDSQKEMIKLAKKDAIFALDSNVFEYYQKEDLSKYSSRLNITTNERYTYGIKNSGQMPKLFSAYIQTLDPEVIKTEGLYNHAKTVVKYSIAGKIAEYLIALFVIAILFLTLFYKKTKKVIVTKKIRNDEKIKYIDLLTSLKNRNYLSENMQIWNNNKIYPQTMIVIDLNNIAFLNDTKGYEAGDRQITSLANILIKTQLDNSDVMRTNGNEFLIYLVGYQQKQIVNYIHKLTKEFKKLPYEYGAAIGYSMINDDIKTVEDAINEAIEDMKKQKEKTKEAKN